MEFGAGNYGIQRPAVYPRHPAKMHAELIEQAQVAEACGFIRLFASKVGAMLLA